MPRALTITLAGTAALTAATSAYAVQPLRTDRVASGLNRPVFVGAPNGDLDRLFIVEQRGVIKILNLDDETINVGSFLNIDSLVTNISGNDERGLLGLAFHPDYFTNGYFYVNYTNNSSDTTIARYQVAGDPNTSDAANPSSATTLRIIDQPFSNHNGGWIGFSPIAGTNLYIATGDGGGANDTGNRAQDITNQSLGKMLRYDVGAAGTSFTATGAASVIGAGGDNDIWAYGLRNPWRNSFDHRTGDFYYGDVGQNAWEEIDRERAGGTGGFNYGWRCREGAHPFNSSGNPCTSLTDPIQEYSHPTGFSLTGGYNYRGCDIPDLQNTYFYADFAIQHIWSFRYTTFVTEFTERTSELSPSIDSQTVNQISSFGEDGAGEMYICDRGGATTGQIFKIIPATPRSDGDVNLDQVIDVNDLVDVIQFWGDCDNIDPCMSDVALCDFVTDVNDLVKVIENWSP